MTSRQEREVACYVLAYLARQGYSRTMSAFLQECTTLPPHTAMMVLPEVPLGTIIAEYKARKESELLVDKLGAQASWQALWANLQHYIDKLRSLSATLLESHNESHIKKATVRKKHQRLKPRGFVQLPHVAACPQPHSVTYSVTPPPPLLTSSSPIPSTSSSSPRKKRRDPSRLVPASSAEPGPSSSVPHVPAPQQLLDVFLGDKELQNKLADLINHTVFSSDVPASAAGQLLTDEALDQILALACADVPSEATTHSEMVGDRFNQDTSNMTEGLVQQEASNSVATELGRKWQQNDDEELLQSDANLDQLLDSMEHI